MNESKNLRIDRTSMDKLVKINYGKNIVSCLENEPLGISLYASNILFLGRSKRLYRPRGLFSLSKQARNIILSVNGITDVCPSEIYVKDGMVVEPPQKPPYAVRALAPFIDTTLLHRRLIKNRLVWPRIAKIIKRSLNDPVLDLRYRKKECSLQIDKADVVIVGGGIAGLSAALHVADHGLDVLLIDENRELGGCAYSNESILPGLSKPSKEYVEELISRVRIKNIKVLTDTVFNGFFEDCSIATSFDGIDRQTIHVLKAKAYVIATGKFDLPCIFGNNDLPGIVGSVSAMKMLSSYGVLVGRNVAIVGCDEWAEYLAYSLKRNGANVVFLQKGSNKKELPDMEIISGVQEIKAIGRDRVKGVKIEHEDGRKELSVDAIVCAAMLNADFRIPAQIGANILYVNGLGFIPAHDIYMRVADNVFVAGGVTGSPYSVLHEIEGKIAALSAVSTITKHAELDEEISEVVKEYRMLLSRFGLLDAKDKVFKSFRDGKPPTEKIEDPKTVFCSSPRKDAFLCFCEDIRLWDIHHAIKSYEVSCIEKIKRLTGIGTGRCQGRLCLVNASLYATYLLGCNPNDVGITRQRPPLISIPMHVAALGAE